MGDGRWAMGDDRGPRSAVRRLVNLSESTQAGVAELADASDLKSEDLKRVVWVRFPPPAQHIQALTAPAVPRRSSRRWAFLPVLYPSPRSRGATSAGRYRRHHSVARVGFAQAANARTLPRRAASRRPRRRICRLRSHRGGGNSGLRILTNRICQFILAERYRARRSKAAIWVPLRTRRNPSTNAGWFIVRPSTAFVRPISS